MAARAVKKQPAFEEGLARLEALAQRMESGEMPLEELLKAYEEGMKLAGELGKRLSEFEGRMREVSSGKDGAPVLHETDVAAQTGFLDDLEGE